MSKSGPFIYISPEDEPLLFNGIDGTECEEFIHAIRKLAYDAGKMRDVEWITEMAASCFVGEALRWHIFLDDEIQTDWKQLQKAMVTRWPSVRDRNIPSAAPAPAPPPPRQNVPPVAAPPTPNRTPLPQPVQSAWRPFTGFQIFVKNLAGRTIVITAEKTTSVWNLKRSIAAKDGIPVPQQRLTYQGRELDDSRDLDYYNIGSESTVHLSTRLLSKITDWPISPSSPSPISPS